MNWVGGSRNRLVMKNDTKKQREFFAKRKLQQKLRTLGVTPPGSSAGDKCSGSTDLLTLFVVNQIASKKTNQEPPKVAVFGRSKGAKPWRNEPLVLPMSPCSPSNLSLADSPAQFSFQEIRKLKSSQRITNGRLSPVPESGFSDNSASDYLPHTSPSTSFASGRGLFPLQTNEQKQSLTLSQPLPHYSPPPWDTSALQQAEFQPFSQPRGMTNPISWSVRSNPPSFQLETPTPSHVLFGSPKPDKTEAGGHGGHSGPFCLDQLETNQPMLDFPISQSEPIHLFEENIFTMFNDNTHGTESALFGNGCSKIYLRKESSVRLSSPQTVPSPQAVGMELSNGTHRNSSKFVKCLQVSSSVSVCMLDESCCESCGHESGFYLDEACSDNLKSASQRITVLSQPRPLTPLTRSSVNVGDSQNMKPNEASTDNKASGCQQSVSSVTPPSSHNSRVCRCKKAESRDTATQTVCSGTCDVSTQCSFDANGETKAKALCRSAVDASRQFPVNERETDMETQTLRAPSQGSASKGATPWSRKESRTGSGGRIFNIVPSERILQGPINPLLGVWRPEGEENGDESEQTGPGRENLVKEESDEGREEVRGHTLGGGGDASRNSRRFASAEAEVNKGWWTHKQK
ncbi:PREDICTED: uncharacterized protein C12orf40 homolog isoform X2 [Poecilia mexicana]|uniref:uncharacterized protein C12orf40 homolog isoform X2 n=1 Tax=Poecilia mexicana TaxID=48701 RepID=UPI00072E6451|nr:PREDICTED: uncharacterized protein C12orf40 homolog isoform X2 [Poecilia mexicana]